MNETPNTLDNSRYEIAEQLGAGGMGEVWAATDRSLGRRVAIKLLPAHLMEDATLRARFQQEVATSARIHHPNIVPLHDVGVENGRLFLVMALVDGPDLRRLLHSGPLDPVRARARIGDIAAALEAVHDAGFVHRDVKPANVLIGNAGTATEYAALADFGIARALGDAPGLTQGRPPGTALYMAPETWREWQANEDADQYALACVAFEMFAGAPPFSGGSLDELEAEHCDEPPPDLREVSPELPRSLAQALQRAMSVDPGARFPSIATFAQAIESVEFDWSDEAPAKDVDAPPRHELAPSRISTTLFGIAPDRDERAPQLAMETFLTLWANGYAAPANGKLRAPKRRNAAVRSLALGTNFLEGLDEPGTSGHSPEELGAALAAGRDFANSANLGLAQRALRALIDPQTEQGSAGASLLYPFHESLLWFDARKSATVGARWAVRKVNMRGTGITLARMLLDPPQSSTQAYGQVASEAVAGIKVTLQAPSPFARLAERLQSAVPTEADHSADPEPAETRAWDRASDTRLADLAEKVVRHSANIATDERIDPATRILRLRSILALDVAHHILNRSWEVSDVAQKQRYLLLTYAPERRRDNRVRIAGEASYLAARQTITQALIAVVGTRARQLAEQGANLHDQFEARSKLEAVAGNMEEAANEGALERMPALAGRVYEEAKGGGYGRPVDAFRVLLESIDLLTGTGVYRWLRAQPDLLGAMVSATSPEPVEVPEFLEAVRAEWDIVVGEAEAVGTDLENALDGGVLSRNTRHLERLMVASGMAQALSDQTCVVGERLRGAT